MANEYLKRTPTSTGNQKVWTLSTWIKQIDTTGASGNGSFLFGYFDEGASPTPRGSIQINESATSGKHSIGWNPTGSSWYQTTPEGRYRDNQNWYHLLVAIDTTKSAESDGVQMYINGVKRGSESYLGTWGSGAAALNIDTGFNSLVEHYIGAFAESVNQSKLQYSDFFYIDGQQLGPEVFGFYKDGNGYISAGSTQSTDFRNGQWVPRTPREIKNLINDNGGFGVNGFYLPMNDSSNFGADFHCAPNSIIKLKGEDLPQPRNGAPETTDAYVSQLRSDPYAANLVLAIPGISTATGANLISNGTFDNGTSGWTVINSSAALSVDSQGRLQVTRTGTNLNAYQYITTEIGKRYTVSANLWSGTGGNFIIRAYQSDLITSYGTTSGSTGDKKSLSFTALETTTSIILSVDNSGTAFVDNIVVRQEDAPRDYSADIKGSGTNKTLTANGNAGVGYEIPGYYGSAMSFDGTGDYFSQTYNADFNFGTSDFTIEMWVNPNAVNSNDGLFGVSGGSGSNPKLVVHLDSGIPKVHFGHLPGSSNIYVNSSVSIPANQWSHLAFERTGSTATWYVNGVASIVDTALSQNVTFTNQPMYIGYGGESFFDSFDGKIQDLRVYKGVAKYKGGFDVPKPYTPVGIESWRQVSDTCQNNFATFNPLVGAGTAANNNVAALSSGNLYYDNANQSWTISSIGVSSGKYYAEFMCLNGTLSSNIAVVGDALHGKNNESSHSSSGISYIRLNSPSIRKSYTGSVNESVYAPMNYSSGDIVGVTIDYTNREVKFYKNNNLIFTDNSLSSYSPLDSSYYFTAFRTNDGVNGSNWSDVIANFGQNPSFSGQITAGTYTDSNGKGLFKYQPPSGFLALCEDNLPTPTIKDPGEYFKTVLWTGDGANGRSITGVGFTPDLVWIKGRNVAYNHRLYDSVRGGGKDNYLLPNSSAVESDGSNLFGGISSFDNDGFSMVYGSGGSNIGINESTKDYVAWCWKAGGAAVSNTDGTITSQVSVNQDAGFSIVSWTSTGSNDALQTVGHGLNTAPNMIILKNRDATVNWRVYHSGITSGNSLTLNSTEASYSFWPSVGNDTFGLSNSTTTGQASGTGNQDIIAYCWSEIEGFSKFGSYVGNGSADGPFVYCGFKPAFVLCKISTTTGNWIMKSNHISTNPNDFTLLPDASDAEYGPANTEFDFLSNGFKIRTSSVLVNTSNAIIVFAAFAESPFKTANAK